MKRFLPLLCTLLLACCGFQPLHGQEYRSTLSVDLSSITINVMPPTMSSSAITGGSLTNASTSIPRRYGELLKAEIQDRVNPMNTAGEKLFTMNISYTETDLPMFVQPDGTATRGNMIYASKYTITRNLDGKVVSSGGLQSTSSYNTSPTAQYASYVSIEDARKRAVLDLAETYKLRLAALLPTLNSPTGTAIEKPPENIPALQPIHSYENSAPGY